jgi:hypothetical protein
MLALLIAMALPGVGGAAAEARVSPAFGGVKGIVVDAEGNGVEGAKVVLLSFNAPPRETLTGPNGGFAFKNVKPGPHGLHAHKEGVGLGNAKVWVKAGEVAMVKIGLQVPVKPGAVIGTVVDSEGNAVAGAKVKLGIPGNPNGPVMTTNDKGQFKFGPLKPGKYGVVAFKLDVGQGKAPVEVKSGEVTKVEITLVK